MAWSVCFPDFNRLAEIKGMLSKWVITKNHHYDDLDENTTKDLRSTIKHNIFSLILNDKYIFQKNLIDKSNILKKYLKNMKATL